MVSNWCQRYQQQGLKYLEDAPRSGRSILIGGQPQTKITALAYSQAPAGCARWALRLLADKVVELSYCQTISHTQVGKIQKIRSKATSQQDLVRWQD